MKSVYGMYMVEVDEQWEFLVPEEWSESDIKAAFDDGSIWEHSAQMVDSWHGVMSLTGWEQS